MVLFLERFAGQLHGFGDGSCRILLEFAGILRILPRLTRSLVQSQDGDESSLLLRVQQYP